ncbi:protein of unknown function [Clostridium cavendishii DSM 21758]|uniref:DUF1848 domain-containing protein n=1 Tax=Clostridium cavendishii DSM 21758 TaxID=1121302 RepID=A0A1M6I6C3_9CLOT|nr:DUF1848 domain-containing protein [Clostridium cavendishii]SHJ29986.1 protein of unknown function [Clostridium cavendishii DSM 21758]
MILSASRRTDIPAFYSEWFFERIKEGYFMVRNPMSPNQVSRVSLSPAIVDCIVFWTKNPRPMMDKLNELKAYNYYFQFTLNSYDTSLELNVPSKKYLIETFIKLSKAIGKEKVIWRYDPIVLTDVFNKEYHYKWFDYLAYKLSKYTDRCVISFLDLYKKTERNLRGINVKVITKLDMEEMASELSKIASKYGLTIESCSEDIDLYKFNIKHGKCIDDKVISKIIGSKVSIPKDINQREICGCVKSVDMGAYNTCRHGCLYCYANYSEEAVSKNIMVHDKKSCFIIGKLTLKDKVSDRKDKVYTSTQIGFFD